MKILEVSGKKLNSRRRLHHLPIPVVALTGGVASGKSVAAEILRDLGYVVINADQLIKDIYAQKTTVSFVRKLLPLCVGPQRIDFRLLRAEAFGRPEILRKLEKYLYARLERAFKARLKRAGRPKFVIYEVPLLYEKELQDKVDAVIVVSTPREKQIQRLMKRDKIKRSLALKMLGQQYPLKEKKKVADAVIENQGRLKQLQAEVEAVVEEFL